MISSAVLDVRLEDPQSLNPRIWVSSARQANDVESRCAAIANGLCRLRIALLICAVMLSSQKGAIGG